MIFRSRIKHHPFRVIREYLWPSSGWRRAFLYFQYRLARLPGTPHSIAAGLACGAAISFTPFLGLHLVLALVMAWALGANVLASAIGTVLGNPWTFPFIWLWTYRVGAFALGRENGELGAKGPHIFANILQHPLETLSSVMLPLTVGGLLTAAIVWWAVFWTTRRLITSLKQRRRKNTAG
ncbi:MAG: DUF2062 domain-containing protein [Sphingomonadales bacterium]